MATPTTETHTHRLLLLEPVELEDRVFRHWRYEVVQLPASEVDAAQLLSYKPDAIFASFSPISTVLFETIRVLEPYPVGPLLVFITDNPSNSSAADVCLSWQNPEPVLVPLLQARDATRELFENNQDLLKANHEIKQELHRERLLRDASEILKNMIVRNVSHELRTPLLQIKTAVALMAETLPTVNQNQTEAEQTTTLVELATRATTRLETHVRNITMLGENMDVKIAPMNLRDAAEAAKRNLSRLWEFRDQVERIQIQIPSNLPPVLGDKNGISTVLQLLLDNALKFSEREVILKARVSKTPTGTKTVEVCVQDFGIGIASGEIDKIFDTFYQVDGSETRHYGGAGVGLALVRIILVKHGIEIRVDSEIGRGSSFSFCMPIMLNA
jgi:signal transduction histidine kinase